MLENAGSSGVSRQPDGKLELTFHAAVVGKLAVPGGLALSTWLGGSATKTELGWAEVSQVVPVKCVWSMYTDICVCIQIYYVYVLYRYFFSIFVVYLPKRMENLVILAPEQVAFEVRIWSLSIFWENWVSFHKLGPQLKVIVPKAPWNMHSFRDKSSEWLMKSLYWYRGWHPWLMLCLWKFRHWPTLSSKVPFPSALGLLISLPSIGTVPSSPSSAYLPCRNGRIQVKVVWCRILTRRLPRAGQQVSSKVASCYLHPWGIPSQGCAPNLLTCI